MADIYSAVVLPTGEIKIEDKEIVITHCQFSACTPQNALKAAFTINKLNDYSFEDSFFEVSNESIDQDEELIALAEQCGLSVEEMLKAITASSESEKQTNCSLSIRITNQCIENAKVNFHVDRSRMICVEDGQEIWCQGFVSVTKMPNGILLRGSSAVTKNFSIGETIEVEEGDTIQINDKVVVEFKRLVTEEKLEKDIVALPQDDVGWN